jgi:endonuclease/exonuclease/phosphatase family metal-dependent hydrolase
MSFNIRYSESRDGRNIWQNRRPLVGEILRIYRPDVVGFQEVLIDQLRDLERMLPNYHWVGVGREDGDQRGEYAPLFFHHLQVTETGNFWLGDAPEAPSNTWGGQHRICTWARLDGPKPFAVFNTHLESDVAEARARSVPLLSNKIRELAGDFPVFLIGDFNFKPNSQEYQQLSRKFRDSFSEPRGSGKPYVTSHSFSGRRRNLLWRWKGEGRIDYIWTRGQSRVLQSRILYDRPGEDARLYPSDHWPILCDVAFT